MDGSTKPGAWIIGGALVGREELFPSVVERVGAHRLVTLTGAGGVGKTRLAVEVADTIGPRFRDGVWLVDLAAVVDAAAVPDAIASTLRVTPQADTPITQTLISGRARPRDRVDVRELIRRPGAEPVMQWVVTTSLAS